MCELSQHALLVPDSMVEQVLNAVQERALTYKHSASSFLVERCSENLPQNVAGLRIRQLR